MKVMCVIGGTGRGKSTFVKGLLSNLKTSPVVYDVQGEYYQEPIKLPPIKVFVDYVKTLKNRVIVFEEARSFFKHRGYADILENELINKRHNGNYFIFVFHAVHQVPASIMDYIDTYVLFKTEENYNLVKNRFKDNTRIFPNFEDVYNHSDFHFYKEF